MHSTPTNGAHGAGSTSWRRLHVPRPLWTVLKWLLLALVLWFVVRRGYDLWQRRGTEPLEISWSWLLASGAVYLAGWIPSVWFWQKLLLALRQEVRFRDSARGYFCGHLGKYIPGKASVLVIRAALLKDRGSRPGLAALTAGYETLATMGTGAGIAVALAPIAVNDRIWQALPSWTLRFRDLPLLTPMLVIVLTLTMLPVIARLFSRMARRMVPAELRSDDARISIRLLLTGLSVLAIGWALHGLSLGFTLQAISGEPLDLDRWPFWTAAVALATFAGFLALFAPGGVGVREGVLMALLDAQPEITSQQAVLAPVLLRGAWLVAELLAAAALYWMVSPEPAPPAEEPSSP